MSSLHLEFLSGPLDGHVIVVDHETIWGNHVDSPLEFVWDDGLEAQQGIFFPHNNVWYFEPLPGKRNTYLHHDLNRERLKTQVQLTAGDVLQGSSSWLLIQMID